MAKLFKNLFTAVKKRLASTKMTVIREEFSEYYEETGRKEDARLGVELLSFRNLFTGAAALLFLMSFFLSSHLHHTLRAVAYFFGAAAYFTEILMLTDIFKKRIPKREAFMAYCFGPLYVLMGISYLLS